MRTGVNSPGGSHPPMRPGGKHPRQAVISSQGDGRRDDRAARRRRVARRRRARRCHASNDGTRAEPITVPDSGDTQAGDPLGRIALAARRVGSAIRARARASINSAQGRRSPKTRGTPVRTLSARRTRGSRSRRGPSPGAGRGRRLVPCERAVPISGDCRAGGSTARLISSGTAPPVTAGHRSSTASPYGRQEKR